MTRVRRLPIQTLSVEAGMAVGPAETLKPEESERGTAFHVFRERNFGELLAKLSCGFLYGRGSWSVRQYLPEEDGVWYQLPAHLRSYSLDFAAGGRRWVLVNKGPTVSEVGPMVFGSGGSMSVPYGARADECTSEYERAREVQEAAFTVFDRPTHAPLPLSVAQAVREIYDAREKRFVPIEEYFRPSRHPQVVKTLQFSLYNAIARKDPSILGNFDERITSLSDAEFGRRFAEMVPPAQYRYAVADSNLRMSSMQGMQGGLWLAFDRPEVIAENLGVAATGENLKRIMDSTMSEFLSAYGFGLKAPELPGSAAGAFDGKTYASRLFELNRREISEISRVFPERLGEVVGLTHGINLAFCEKDHLLSSLSARNVLAGGGVVDFDSLSKAVGFDLKKVNDIATLNELVLEFVARKMDSLLRSDPLPQMDAVFRRAYARTYAKAAGVILKRPESETSNEAARVLKESKAFFESRD